MTDWRERMIKMLQLNGKGERTQDAYTRAVRMLVQFCRKSPELITEEELREYFLHGRNVSKWSPNTMRICHAGIRFFYQTVLCRKWHTLTVPRAQSEHRLPAVLGQEEVHRLFACVMTPHNHAFLTTVYACGLRLQEALHLEVSDIDSNRMLVHVHRGKGAKDRYVPLPTRTLELLRRHWTTHRNPRLIFPALGRSGREAGHAKDPMAKSSVQGAMRGAKRQAGILKKNVSIHTLRHSYATHLLEAGVHLRAIQRYLGHSRIESTMIYLHLTQKGHDDATQRIEKLMEDL